MALDKQQYLQEYARNFNAIREAARQKAEAEMLASNQAQARFDPIVSNAGSPVYTASDVDRLAGLRNRNMSRITDLTDLSKRFLPDQPVARSTQPAAELAPKTKQDFVDAQDTARMYRTLLGGKSKFAKSRLSQDQLMENAAAYNARKQAEAQARSERKIMGQQVRNFKNMAGLGYNDPVVVRPAVSPQETMAFQLQQRDLTQQAQAVAEQMRLAAEEAAAKREEAKSLADFRNKSLGLQEQGQLRADEVAKLEMELKRAEQKIKEQQLEMQAKLFERNLKDADAQKALGYLGPDLSPLVSTGKMTQEQAIGAADIQALRAAAAGSPSDLVRHIQDRGYEIGTPEFESLFKAAMNGESYYDYSNSFWNNISWEWLPWNSYVPDPNPGVMFRSPAPPAR